MTLNEALEAIKLRKKQEMVNYKYRVMEYDFDVGTMTLDKDTLMKVYKQYNKYVNESLRQVLEEL